MSNSPDRKSVPERIRTSLGDKEYRHSYAEEFLNTWIATQIKILRKQHNWTQPDLAREAGMHHQSAISRLEDMNYSSWSISTLKRLAYAFDVRLKVSFESFGSLIQDFRDFSEDSLKRPDYTHDPVFNETFATTAVTTVIAPQRITEGTTKLTLSGKSIYGDALAVGNIMWDDYASHDPIYQVDPNGGVILVPMDQRFYFQSNVLLTQPRGHEARFVNKIVSENTKINEVQGEEKAIAA